MAPKEQGPSKKNKIKKQDKAIDDRTFGLKNKNKSKKVQDYITGVEKTVKNTNKDAVSFTHILTLMYLIITFLFR